MCHVWIISEVEKEITQLTQGCLVVITTVENYKNHGNSKQCMQPQAKFTTTENSCVKKKIKTADFIQQMKQHDMLLIFAVANWSRIISLTISHPPNAAVVTVAIFSARGFFRNFLFLPNTALQSLETKGQNNRTVDSSALRATWKGPCQGIRAGMFTGFSSVHCYNKLKKKIIQKVTVCKIIQCKIIIFWHYVLLCAFCE